MIQDRVPVRKSTEIVGHNVFFTYLYTGATDLCAENHDEQLKPALDRLWADMTQRKMFITGGVSAHPMTISGGAPAVEAAGVPYQLPNASCYNETCGQIGVFMWGHRLLVNQPEGNFADIMEREMYNGFLPCIGLDGRSWFYRAILRRYDENYKSSGWTDMADRGKPGRDQICCPSNLLRTIAQLGAYFYSRDDEGLWVHHYGGNKVSCQLAQNETLALEQITDYPWAGEVSLVIRQAPARPVALRLRLPGWAGGARVTVNGTAQSNPRIEHGYVSLTQTWKPDDVILFSLPLESQLVAADPRVEETRNQVAVMRGPVLYCVESPDLPKGVRVPDVQLASNTVLKPVSGLPGCTVPLAARVTILQGQGLQRVEPAWADLYRPLGKPELKPFELKLIPYFAWSNRGVSAMSVWMPCVLKDN